MVYSFMHGLTQTLGVICLAIGIGLTIGVAIGDEGGGGLPIPCPNHASRDECKNPGQSCWINGQAGLCAWDNVQWKCVCDPI